MLSSVLPLLSLPPFPPPLPSSLHSWSWTFLYFDFLQALPHRIAFPRDMEKNFLQTHTHTHTHYITIWLPEQPNQSSAGRTTMTMQNGWTQRKGRVEGGMKTSLRTRAFSSYICRLRERGDGLFVSQQREKSEEGCLMQYNKVAHLSSSSLSSGDWSSAGVYSNSHCSEMCAQY